MLVLTSAHETLAWISPSLVTWTCLIVGIYVASMTTSDRGAAVTLALVASGLRLLAVVATLWIGSLLLAGAGDGGSVHDGSST